MPMTIRSLPFLLAASVSGAAPPPPPTVTIQSQPAMASVFWDGHYVGTTPATLRSVPAGRHGLKLTRDGYRNYVQLVTVQGAPVKLSAKLVATVPGALMVESVPSEAEVSVNGEFQGRTPFSMEGIAAGTVQVRVGKEEYLPSHEEVAIEPGKTAKLKITLRSKMEAFLLAEIKRDPSRVNNYAELGHFYMMRRDYDRAFKVYAQGMAACVGPKAIPNDCLRLYNEIQYCYDGDVVKFAEQANLDAFRQRFTKLFEDAIKRVPSNERNYWQLATIKRKSSDWQACIQLYEQSVKHARNKRIKHRAERGAAQMRYRYAAALSKKKQYEQAAAEYEKTLTRYPRAYYSRTALANAISLYSSRVPKPAKVEQLRRHYLKYFPRSESAPTHLRAIADALVAQGQYKQALAEYQRYLKEYPDHDNCPAVMMAMVNCYRSKLNDQAGALRTYMESAKRYPEHDGNASALLAAAKLHQARGETAYAEALHALIVKRYPLSLEATQVDDDPKRKATYQQAASMYSQASSKESRDPKGAIALYEKVVASCPRTYYAPQALIKIANRHQNSTKDFDAEMAARKRFVDLYPDNDQAPAQLTTMASRYASVGSQYSKNAKDDEAMKAKAVAAHYQAIEAYRRLVKEFPKSDSCPSAQYQLALVYHKKTFEQKKAIPELRVVVDKWPHHSYASASLYYIGWIYFLCLKDTSEEAIESFRELLTRYPYESYASSIEYWLDAVQEAKPEPAGWWK